jgi:hypothetical protein
VFQALLSDNASETRAAVLVLYKMLHIGVYGVIIRRRILGEGRNILMHTPSNGEGAAPRPAAISGGRTTYFLDPVSGNFRRFSGVFVDFLDFHLT